MATHILRDQQLWIDEHDFTSDMSSMAVDYSAEPTEETTFGDNTRIMAPGLLAFSWAHEGFWQAGADSVDESFFTDMGTGNQPMTIGGTGAEGGTAFLTRVLEASYQPLGGEIGERHKFAVSGNSSDNLVRGVLMKNGTETVTGNGTAYQVGAVSATQSIYAALHVTAAAGSTPSLTVSIASDSAENFGVSPETQLTFGALAVPGSGWQVAGPAAITDDWWRAEWTISGGSPSFAFVVSFGIL